MRTHLGFGLARLNPVCVVSNPRHAYRDLYHLGSTMPDCFISYASKDAEFAKQVCTELRSHDINVFMAETSLRPGDQWSERILRNLKNSDWVLFLASAEACASPYVQQELGVALGAEKKLIPVVWDMAPSELPGWINQTQALILRDQSIEQSRAQMAQIALAVRQDKREGWLILGVIIGALLLFGGRES